MQALRQPLLVLISLTDSNLIIYIMKKIVLFLCVAILAVVGCSRQDDFGTGGDLKPNAFSITVKYSQANNALASNAKIKMENTSTGDVITGTTNSNGELKLDNVLPGNYNITGEVTLSKADYEKLFGEKTDNTEVYFGGQQEKVTVNANVTSTILNISSGKLGELVIKQYYYAGSDSKLGATFRDQFVEIHNNSDKTIFADGLYVALIEGNTNNNVTSYTLPNGQYDWSKSGGIGSTANTDYVYAGSVIQVPGTGTQYPIEPGKSIVIAQTAINHKAPFDGNDGKSVTIQNPELTVDLSKADFEVYLGDYAKANGSKPYQWDIQNVLVPDMNIIFWSNPVTDWILNLTHRPALVIFRSSATEIESFKKIANPAKPTGNLFLQIPKRIIIDGVDITDKEQKVPKDLPGDIDATRTFINNNGLGLADYTGFSVMRKTKEVINGRTILLDTNNSAKDFTTVKANPRGYAQ